MATFRSSCGNSITADDKFCRVCGRSVSAEWRVFIADAESAADVNPLRRATHAGRPLGSPHSVAGLEELTSRPLAPRKGGRPKNPRRLQASHAHLGCLVRNELGYVPSVTRVPFPRSHSEACDQVRPGPTLKACICLFRFAIRPNSEAPNLKSCHSSSAPSSSSS